MSEQGSALAYAVTEGVRLGSRTTYAVTEGVRLGSRTTYAALQAGSEFDSSRVE
jgi:hypothetical protein